ncbi:sterol desaturase family protein [Streptomyces sp. NPDC057271]|uniref:sterol desaturase family protein n=1 Tax=unclassified Streptomyces TaxID=2593676 RepID=UPI00362E5C93
MSETELPQILVWAAPAFLLLIVVEWLSYRFHSDDEELGYSAKDTATSMTMGAGTLAFGLLWRIPPLVVYSALYTVTPLRVPVLCSTLPLILLAQDFCYYWEHRSHHVVRFLWATHVVHHSSRYFNFSTAVRSPWFGAFSFPFHIPIILAGVHPAALAFCATVNLVYQFWLHTERIGRLPGPVEYVFNTPSHHRVHHASQGGYLDRNFGGILIVWDRVFGSFAPETVRPVYGLRKNIDTYNPWRVATHEWVAIGRDIAATRGWRHRVRVFVHLPGSKGYPALTDAFVVPRDDRET